MIEKKPFVNYTLEEDKDSKADSFTVWLNKEERTELEVCKQILEQRKDSTALKTLAWIGSKTIREPKTSYILGAIFKNKRKNKRIGIVEFE